MRIATLIIGLVLTVGLFFQSLTVSVLSDAVNTEDDGADGALGVGISVIWLVACALVIPWPLVSMFLFGFGGVLGLAGGASTEFSDLTVWGIISFILALFSFLGWRGKKKQRAEEAARDEQLQQSLAAQQYMAAQLQYLQQQNAYNQQYPQQQAPPPPIQ